MENRSPHNDLARAHFQIQQYHKRWDPVTGLFRGTVFSELYRPYHYEADCQPDAPGPVKQAKNAKVRGGKNHGQS